MNVRLNTKLVQLDLSASKTMLLFCLYDNKIMTQIEICKELDMDKSTVAKMILRLEGEGLVLKEINPNDTRSHLISLTETANAVMEQAKAIHEQWVCEVTEDMTELEREVFSKLLNKAATKANSLCNE